MTPAEFERVRAPVQAYAHREGYGGPKPGRLLLAFVDVLAATGARPSEVLATRWSDVDRTVATVVRDGHGPALAQQQLSHSKLTTTEAHYPQRQTRGPDVRSTLDRFAGECGG
jgi:integrase